MITFVGIEDRGAGFVAVFEHDACFSDNKSFALNREGLLNRIANVEAGKAHPNRDASVERGALSSLEASMKKEGQL